MNVCVITAYVVTLLSEMTFGIQMWQSLYVVAGTALNSVGFREQQFICALSVEKVGHDFANSWVNLLGT